MTEFVPSCDSSSLLRIISTYSAVVESIPHHCHPSCSAASPHGCRCTRKGSKHMPPGGQALVMIYLGRSTGKVAKCASFRCRFILRVSPGSCLGRREISLGIIRALNPDVSIQGCKVCPNAFLIACLRFPSRCRCNLYPHWTGLCQHFVSDHVLVVGCPSQASVACVLWLWHGPWIGLTHASD